MPQSIFLWKLSTETNTELFFVLPSIQPCLYFYFFLYLIKTERECLCEPCVVTHNSDTTHTHTPHTHKVGKVLKIIFLSELFTRSPHHFSLSFFLESIPCIYLILSIYFQKKSTTFDCTETLLFFFRTHTMGAARSASKKRGGNLSMKTFCFYHLFTEADDKTSIICYGVRRKRHRYAFLYKNTHTRAHTQ